mmetsp:Transcript_83086/g.144307  ORF Transcript_83086/g.144307 Transcript_83086/m.144307 type:complete len:115 (+) Transcript_83086:521-865(+)
MRSLRDKEAQRLQGAPAIVQSDSPVAASASASADCERVWSPKLEEIDIGSMLVASSAAREAAAAPDDQLSSGSEKLDARSTKFIAPAVIAAQGWYGKRVSAYAVTWGPCGLRLV